MSWFSNSLDNLAKVGQKAYGEAVHLGGKINSTYKAGEKVINNISDVANNPSRLMNDPRGTIGGVINDASNVVTQGSGVLNSVDRLGKIVIGDDVWNASGLGTIGLAGDVGNEMGRAGNMAGRMVQNKKVSNKEAMKLGSDMLDSGAQYVSNKMGGKLAKKYGFKPKNANKYVKKMVDGIQGSKIGDQILKRGRRV